MVTVCIWVRLCPVEGFVNALVECGAVDGADAAAAAAAAAVAVAAAVVAVAVPAAAVTVTVTLAVVVVVVVVFLLLLLLWDSFPKVLKEHYFSKLYIIQHTPETSAPAWALLV